MSCPLCKHADCRKIFVLRQSPTPAVCRCPGCGGEFLVPQPSDEALAKLYSASYYDAWGLRDPGMARSVEAMKLATFRLRIALIRRFVPAGRILDVGCATGYFLQAAMEAGFEAHGVEFSPYSAAIAQERFGTDRVFHGVLEESPHAPGSLDVMAMSDLLEHVRDPLATLTYAAGLLRPEGVLMVMTPDTGSFTRKVLGFRWTHYKPEHLFYFNRKSMENLAALAGLRVVHQEPAIKFLNLAYFNHQFRIYPNALFTPVFSLLGRLLPAALLRRNLPLTIGEGIWVLEKPELPTATHSRNGI